MELRILYCQTCCQESTHNVMFGNFPTAPTPCVKCGGTRANTPRTHVPESFTITSKDVEILRTQGIDPEFVEEDGA